MREKQTDKTQPSDFARALNSMMDNLENVVVTFQKTLLVMLEKIEKLESLEKSFDTAPNKKGPNTEEMKQLTNAATTSAEMPASAHILGAEMKQRISYLEIKFVLGLVTLVVGFIAADLALFHWVERTGVYHLLGDYARYVCAYGGFAAMIFGAMLINDFLVLRNVLKGKYVTDKEITVFAEVDKEEEEKEIVDRGHKNRGKIAAITLAIFLFMLCPIVVSSIVSYTATVMITPRNWWNLDYEYRRQITIVNNIASTLGSGYSVCLTVNTTSLVSSGKMLPSGNDLRIVYWNGSSWVEIDRDVIDMNTGSTQVWFKTQADISASGSDNNYYMYYGNPSAVNPPANKSNVYVLLDDFNDGDYDGWTPVGSIWTASSGFLDNKDTSGGGKYIRKDGYNVTESVLIKYRGLIDVDRGNFIYLNVLGTVTGSSTGSGYCLGINADTDRVNIVRVDDGSRTVIDYVDKVIDPDIWYNITIIYFINGTMSAEVGGSKVTVTDTTYSTPFELGTWCRYEASYDDVMVRKYVFPEPSAYTGSEENL